MDTSTEIEEVNQIEEEGNKIKSEKEVIEEPFQFETKIKKENIEDFLKSLLIFADEGMVTINKNGIETRVVDSSHSFMVTTTLNEGGMFKYSMSDSEKRMVGTPIKMILKLIGKAKKNEAIQIEYLPGTTEKDEGIKITFGALQYDLPLIDVDTIEKVPKPPQIIFPIGITMRSRKFRETMALVSEIADEITFTVPANEDKLTVEGGNAMLKEIHQAEPHILTTIENGDILKFESVKENKNEDENIRIRKGEIKARFDAEKLNKISKIIAKMGKVTIRTDTDYPCEIEASFANGYGKIKYLLAPRIE